VLGCSPALPDDERELFYFTGFTEGYSKGYVMAADNPKLWWITPDKIDKIAKTNTTVRDSYIPKGYWTMEDLANAHFSDGTPYNRRQKETILEGYNWGFYSGFRKGVDDFLEGKPPIHIR